MSVCLHPIKLKNGCIVPCGRCVTCRNRLRSSWAFRMQEEFKHNDFAVFCTFTYSPDNVPYKCSPYRYTSYGDIEFFSPCRYDELWISYYGSNVHKIKKNKCPIDFNYKIWSDDEAKLMFNEYVDTQTLDKKSIQKFLDNLQHFLKRKHNCKLRYFISGEYGKNGHLPHYHSIFFFKQVKFNGTLPYLIDDILEKFWSYGFIQVDHDVNPLNIMYTTKYMIKGGHSPDGSDKMFSLKSQGLGRDFLKDKGIEKFLVNQFNEEGSAYVRFTESGVKTPCPRYYRDKIFSDYRFEETEQRLKMKLEVQHKTFLKDSETIRKSYINYLTIHNLKNNFTNYQKFLNHYSGSETLDYLENTCRGNLHTFESDGQ